ncbi:MAG TPA: hypothetical protein PKJ41_21535 [Bryobacteraceae bacterium]|nr:hypothetical protein [Bryobacteraceae bacterium]
MNETLLKMIVPAIGLISGLVATYVSLQNRALLADVRREIAEMENRLFVRINGTYIRQGECQLRRELFLQRLAVLEEDAKNNNAAG